MSWVEKKLITTKSTQPDRDAVECFVLALLPIVPLKPVHTFDWDGTRYQSVQLRWSWNLVLGCMAQTWAMALIVVGFLVAGITVVATPEDWTPGVVSALIGLAGIGLRFGIRARDQRSRDVRLVLGPHVGGSSDPAMWKPELLTSVPHHSPSDALTALDRGEWAKAMFIARTITGRGEPDGESLTDQILAHPVVAAALPQLRRQPWRRDDLLR